mgnify:CR=1 FL=1
MNTATLDEATIQHQLARLGQLREAIGQAIVGQHDVVEQLLIGLLAGGHCLLEGVPGIGKTLLIRTLARRLAERGVRFIQLYMRGWDQHNNLPNELKAQCGAVDQPQAALIKDLRRRGMLDDTLILWAGEFGRTVYSQGTLTSENYGRDHHPRCYSIWMAGGGIKPGITFGKTDEFCYNVAENPVDVHDLHATMLHCLGIDHTRLTYRYQGRDFRLTDVFGNVRKELLA